MIISIFKGFSPVSGHFPYSRDFVVSHVLRHFPYSRDFVVSLPSRHFTHSRDFVVFPVSRHFKYSRDFVVSLVVQIFPKMTCGFLFAVMEMPIDWRGFEDQTKPVLYSPSIPSLVAPNANGTSGTRCQWQWPKSTSTGNTPLYNMPPSCNEKSIDWLCRHSGTDSSFSLLAPQSGSHGRSAFSAVAVCGRKPLGW